jgi:hypothetical protein
VVLEKSIKAEWDGLTVPVTAVEHIEEYRRPHQGVEPNSPPASLLPSRVSMPRRFPANQNIDGEATEREDDAVEPDHAGLLEEVEEDGAEVTDFVEDDEDHE